jgi:hypothetical protein
LPAGTNHDRNPAKRQPLTEIFAPQQQDVVLGMEVDGQLSEASIIVPQ